MGEVKKNEEKRGKCTGSEVKTFKRLFIAYLRVMGGKISGERVMWRGKQASGRNITGGSFKVVFKSSRLSSSYISKN